jgi:hypothetical protein
MALKSKCFVFAYKEPFLVGFIASGDKDTCGLNFAI